MTSTVSPHACCDICGIPTDAQHFDEVGFLSGNDLPRRGEKATLASIQIHPQYCGVLECFAQYTDLYFSYNGLVRTPGLEWILLRNGQPLFPYQKLESILNPWGYNNYSFRIRLDENSRVEFILHNRNYAFDQEDANKIQTVGGRIMGRFWYNPAYGLQR